MTRSTDITSFTKHRQNLREHLDQVRSTGRPLFVTTNGETDAVVLSAEGYDALAEKAALAESLELLDRSVAELKRGEGKPLERAVRKIAEELSLELKR